MLNRMTTIEMRGAGPCTRGTPTSGEGCLLEPQMEAMHGIRHEWVVLGCGMSQLGLVEIQGLRGRWQSKRCRQAPDHLGQAVDVEADEGEFVPLPIAKQPIVVRRPQTESILDRKTVPTAERFRDGYGMAEDTHELEAGQRFDPAFEGEKGTRVLETPDRRVPIRRDDLVPPRLQIARPADRCGR